MKNNKISAKGKGAGYKVVSKSKGKVTIKSKVTGKTYKGKSVKGLMASRKKLLWLPTLTDERSKMRNNIEEFLKKVHSASEAEKNSCTTEESGCENCGS